MACIPAKVDQQSISPTFQTLLHILFQSFNVKHTKCCKKKILKNNKSWVAGKPVRRCLIAAFFKQEFSFEAKGKVRSDRRKTGEEAEKLEETMRN